MSKVVDYGIYTKRKQLEKVKPESNKSMKLALKEQFKDYIREVADYRCQCGCLRVGDEFHHTVSGADRHDESMILLSQICHYNLHHGVDHDERLRIKREGLKASEINILFFKGTKYE